jgi:hypothetical protein
MRCEWATFNSVSLFSHFSLNNGAIDFNKCCVIFFTWLNHISVDTFSWSLHRCMLQNTYNGVRVQIAHSFTYFDLDSYSDPCMHFEKHPHAHSYIQTKYIHTRRAQELQAQHYCSLINRRHTLTLTLNNNHKYLLPFGYLEFIRVGSPTEKYSTGEIQPSRSK